MSKETTVADIAASAPKLAEHIAVEKQKRRDAMIAFEQWTMDQGFRGINPESMSYAQHHSSFLTEQERAGLRFWINDFRELFFG